MSMMKFDQQVLSDHEKGQYGDCLRACVYVLLQEDIDLPHPVDNGKWNYDFFVDLEEKTKKELLFSREELSWWPDLVIRKGMSPRGISHAVVWSRNSNEIFHDPHPSRLGLVDFEGWYYLK